MWVDSSILKAGLSTHFHYRVSPSSGCQPSAVGRWRAQGPHTHSALRILVKMYKFSSFFSGRNSLGGPIISVLTVLWMVFSPGFRDPAPLVEELPHDDDVVAYHALGHSHPVDFDVWCKVLPSFDCVSIDCHIVGDDEGHHHCLSHLFSLVSLVAHSRYFSSFSLKALLILSVDVIFTSTTTFFHSPPDTRRSHTRSGFSLAPVSRPLSFHSSDRHCSVPMVISSFGASSLSSGPPTSVRGRSVPSGQGCC